MSALPFTLIAGPLCGYRTAACPPRGKHALTLVLEWIDRRRLLWVCFYRFEPSRLAFEFVKMERWPYAGPNRQSKEEDRSPAD